MISCVLCLESTTKNASNFIKINSPEAEELHVKDIIDRHLWFHVEDFKSATCKVCKDCWECLYSFHQFYLRVQRAHKVLWEESTQSVQSFIKVETDVLLEQPIAEVEPIVDSIADNIKLEIDELSEATTIRPTRRRGRPKRYLSPNKLEVPLIEKENDSPLKNEIDETKLINCSEQTVEHNGLMTIEIATNQSGDETISKDHVVSVNQNVTKRNVNTRIRPQSHKSEISRNFDEIIAENFKLSCCICQCGLSDFSALKTHFRVEHNTRGYVLCCGKKLLKRGVLVDHIYTHQDPNYFTCQKCGKVMADRRCLEMHVKNHEISRERTFRCEVCNKGFYRRTIYMRHVLLHLPEEKKTEKCPQCEKTFATKYVLNQHVRLVHLKVDAKVCDVCGKVIRGREALKRHQAEHEGIAHSTARQCHLCGVTLTNKYGLARHIKMMHTAENTQPQVCPICSKVSSNVSSHKRHMLYMHSMERKHACTLCDKAFKRRTDLKEHMTTHTGEVLYRCTFCPKTFNSNANMYSHRKKAHPKEWEESRLKRFIAPAQPSSAGEVHASSMSTELSSGAEHTNAMIDFHPR